MPIKFFKVSRRPSSGAPVSDVAIGEQIQSGGSVGERIQSGGSVGERIQSGGSVGEQIQYRRSVGERIQSGRSVGEKIQSRRSVGERIRAVWSSVVRCLQKQDDEDDVVSGSSRDHIKSVSGFRQRVKQIFRFPGYKKNKTCPNSQDLVLEDCEDSDFSSKSNYSETSVFETPVQECCIRQTSDMDILVVNTGKKDIPEAIQHIAHSKEGEQLLIEDLDAVHGHYDPEQDTDHSTIIEHCGKDNSDCSLSVIIGTTIQVKDCDSPVPSCAATESTNEYTSHGQEPTSARSLPLPVVRPKAAHHKTRTSASISFNQLPPIPGLRPAKVQKTQWSTKDRFILQKDNIKPGVKSEAPGGMSWSLLDRDIELRATSHRSLIDKLDLDKHRERIRDTLREARRHSDVVDDADIRRKDILEERSFKLTERRERRREAAERRVQAKLLETEENIQRKTQEAADRQESIMLVKCKGVRASQAKRSVVERRFRSNSRARTNDVLECIQEKQNAAQMRRERFIDGRRSRCQTRNGRVSRVDTSPAYLSPQPSLDQTRVDTSPAYLSPQPSLDQTRLDTSPAYLSPQPSLDQTGVDTSPAYLSPQPSLDQTRVDTMVNSPDKGSQLSTSSQSSISLAGELLANQDSMSSMFFFD